MGAGLAISQVRDALAELLRSSLGLKYAAGRMPSPLQPFTVFVIPQPGADYVTYDGGSFTRPVVSLSAVVVGPTNNLSEASKWLDSKIGMAPSVVASDPTLGGRTSTVVLDRVSEPGLLDVADSQGFKPYLSAEFRFKPFTIRT